MPINLSMTRSGSSSSRWRRSPVEFAKSISGKSHTSQVSVQSAKSSELVSEPSMLESLDDAIGDFFDGTDQSDGSSRKRGLKPFASIRRFGSDARDDEEEEGQEMIWNPFAVLFPDDRERDDSSYEEDEELSMATEEERGGGFFGLFGTDGERDDEDASSTESISTEDDDDGTDVGSNDGSDKISLSRGVAMTRNPSHFEKLYEKRHGNRDDGASLATGNSNMSSATYLDRFSRKMNIPSHDINVPSQVVEEQSLENEADAKTTNEPIQHGFGLKRNRSFARLLKKVKGVSKKKGTSAVEGLSESNCEDDVPGDVLTNEVPMQRNMSCISHDTINSKGTYVSKLLRRKRSQKRSQKYDGNELLVEHSRNASIDSEQVPMSSTQSFKSDDGAKLRQMMDEEASRAAYEKYVKYQQEEAETAALAAAEAEQAEKKRVAAEKKQQQKLLKAEEKQHKRQMEKEKRATAIARAESKRLEAEARLAAMNAEAAVRKREAEEKKAEEKRAAEIAAATAERLEAEARRAVAEQKMREAEGKRARTIAAAKARREEVEEMQRLEAEAVVVAEAEATMQEQYEAEGGWFEDYIDCPDDEARWAAVAAEAERKSHKANEKKAMEVEMERNAAAERKRQESDARREAAEEEKRLEAEKKREAAERKRQEAEARKEAAEKERRLEAQKRIAAKQKKAEHKKKMEETKRLSLSFFGRGKFGKQKKQKGSSKQTSDGNKDNDTLLSDNKKVLHTGKEDNEGGSVVSDLLSVDQEENTSLSTFHVTPHATPFHRTTTYKVGDITKQDNFQLLETYKEGDSGPIPAMRSVSFQRNGSHRNSVVHEEGLQQSQSITGMSLGDNKYISRSGISTRSRSKQSHRKYCVYEYEEEGNAAVMYCEFNSDPVNMMKVYQYDSVPKLRGNTDEVLIKVQASTVSYSDCLIRQGLWWGSGKVILPATPGVDVVGRVSGATNSALSKFGIQTDDYVASLIRSGGNARYVKIDASKLVKVPSEVDPASAVCVVETYLAAFQSLHLGEDTDTRYNKDALLGKSVLIIGGIAMVGQAMIELAFLAGASAVYVTARQKHYDFLRSLGAIPVPLDIDEWMPFVSGRMDVVVDAYCTDHYSSSQSALNSRGKLVCIRTRSTEAEEPGLLWHAEALWAKLHMNIDQMSRTYTYDVFESWEENLRLCKNDLKHLFQMLRMGIVEPPIADCIPLTKVPQAQHMYETKRIQGYFVCEPWLKQKKKAAYC